jgi:hypothetical protein
MTVAIQTLAGSSNLVEWDSEFYIYTNHNAQQSAVYLGARITPAIGFKIGSQLAQLVLKSVNSTASGEEISARVDWILRLNQRGAERNPMQATAAKLLKPFATLFAPDRYHDHVCAGNVTTEFVTLQY